MRARVGRVDVAAEVERLGLARLGQRARPGEPEYRAAELRQEPASRAARRDHVRELRATQARTAPRLRSAAASTVSNCAPVLNVPFASTVPSASKATANGLPGTSAAARPAASAPSSNVGRPPAAGVRNNAPVGASGRQTLQHSEVNTASPICPKAIWPPNASSNG